MVGCGRKRGVGPDRKSLELALPAPVVTFIEETPVTDILSIVAVPVAGTALKCIITIRMMFRRQLISDWQAQQITSYCPSCEKYVALPTVAAVMGRMRRLMGSSDCTCANGSGADGDRTVL